MNRVAVLGNTASGKSHLARAVADRLSLPLTQLDSLYWRPGWTHVSPADFRRQLHSLIHTPRWVIDGTFTEYLLRDRFATADIVLFLDFPPSSCLRRAASRRGTNRPDLPPGANDADLPPTRALAFAASTLLFNIRERPRILSAARHHPGKLRTITSWRQEPSALSDLIHPTN